MAVSTGTSTSEIEVAIGEIRGGQVVEGLKKVRAVVALLRSLPAPAFEFTVGLMRLPPLWKRLLLKHGQAALEQIEWNLIFWMAHPEMVPDMIAALTGHETAQAPATAKSASKAGSGSHALKAEVARVMRRRR